MTSYTLSLPMAEVPMVFVRAATIPVPMVTCEVVGMNRLGHPDSCQCDGETFSMNRLGHLDMVNINSLLSSSGVVIKQLFKVWQEICHPMMHSTW